MKIFFFILLFLKLQAFAETFKDADEYSSFPVYNENMNLKIKAERNKKLEEKCFNEGSNDISECRYTNKMQYEDEMEKGMNDNTDPHFTASPANQKPVF